MVCYYLNVQFQGQRAKQISIVAKIKIKDLTTMYGVSNFWSLFMKCVFILLNEVRGT